MRYAYETLLRLYPNSWRLVFGQEMASVFEQATEDYQPRGLLAYLTFLCSEFNGLIAGAFFAWGDEYLSRSRRRVNAPFLVSLFLGAAITAFFQGNFYTHITDHKSVFAPAPEAPQLTPDLMLPLLIAGGILLFISVFSVAFVWNMRIIGNRSGRLKPIWMPGRAANARITRRDQTIQRNTGRPRREFYRRGR